MNTRLRAEHFHGSAATVYPPVVHTYSVPTVQPTVVQPAATPAAHIVVHLANSPDANIVIVALLSALLTVVVVIGAVYLLRRHNEHNCSGAASHGVPHITGGQASEQQLEGGHPRAASNPLTNPQPAAPATRGGRVQTSEQLAEWHSSSTSNPLSDAEQQSALGGRQQVHRAARRSLSSRRFLDNPTRRTSLAKEGKGAGESTAVTASTSVPNTTV
jgi:hypothetical protein